MTPKVPSIADLTRAARCLGLDLTPEELEFFAEFLPSSLSSFARVDELDQPTLNDPGPRPMGYRPAAADNPCNAWYWKCSIPGNTSGLLSGKRVVAKDNICVAGIPMMNGTAVLEGYVPEFDATVVTRILEAGGEIVGKAVCESLSFGGSSFTADTGPVHNPYDPSRTTGGSASGAAALVALGEADVAVATDQGGSTRIPAAWCGLYGLKPTYGLVPYTGIFSSEVTLDHVGTLATTVADTALLLEAIAARDPLDPRQRDVSAEPFSSGLDVGDLRGLRVGLLKEGFCWDGLSEADVDEAVRAAALHFATMGAQVREVSVPLHKDGIHIWRVIGAEGRTMTMIRGSGMGTNWRGHYSVSLLEAFTAGLRSRANRLSDSVKQTALLGEYMNAEYHGRYYAKAQNLARVLTSAFDSALESVDLLALPTTPMKPTLLPSPKATREERLRAGFIMSPNTCPFNVTGHPAISVPCARLEGLPIGMMLVARRWEEATLLRAARCFEQSGWYGVRSASLGKIADDAGGPSAPSVQVVEGYQIHSYDPT